MLTVFAWLLATQTWSPEGDTAIPSTARATGIARTNAS